MESLGIDRILLVYGNKGVEKLVDGMGIIGDILISHKSFSEDKGSVSVTLYTDIFSETSSKELKTHPGWLLPIVTVIEKLFSCSHFYRNSRFGFSGQREMIESACILTEVIYETIYREVTFEIRKHMEITREMRAAIRKSFSVKYSKVILNKLKEVLLRVGR